jgi:DNA-directed RNA polymerase subunit H (RpoH/RPB5)
MAAENYVNLYFSEEKIRLTVLTNICRMMVTRGYMDADKYKRDPEKPVNKDAKQSIIEQLSANDKIDNSLFLPFIETRIDNNTYIIPLDTPYRDQREEKGEANVEFDGSVVIVKIIPQILKDISNSPLLNEFFKQYNKNHKIIVFDGMADKVYNVLSKKKNVEVFDRNYLMIDLMSHRGAPVSCSLVTNEDIKYITNLKIAKILENDPMCRYYNGKKGLIIRVVRTSLNNSEEIVYRKVIEPKSVFK